MLSWWAIIRYGGCQGGQSARVPECQSATGCQSAGVRLTKPTAAVVLDWRGGVDRRNGAPWPSIDPAATRPHSSGMNNTTAARRSLGDARVPLLWHLLQTAHELEARIESELEPLGLSLAKVGVLQVLVQADEPMALSDLAERNSCVRSNITQLMDRLETDGLVRRVSDSDDRRVRRAALTSAGRTLTGQAAQVIAEQQQRIAKTLSRDEALAFTQALERLSRS